LVKLQMGSSIEELSEMNFELNLSRDRDSRGDRGDRGTRGRDRDRSGRRGRDKFEKGGRRGLGREKGRREDNMARLFLNLGKKDRIRPNDIVGAIAGEAGISGKQIGGIDIFDNFSFVDVPSKDAAHVINVMKSNTIKGKPVNMELSKG